MNFLPVTARELRVTARQPATYRLRLWTVGVLCLIWLVLMLTAGQRVPPYALSRQLFYALAVPCFGLALLAGVFLTADCLSRERREGTLGLLFLTELRVADVVLGKLISTSANALTALLAVLPLFALPVLLGGITGADVLHFAMVLVVTFFLSLSVGLLASAVSSESRSAMRRTFVTMTLLAGLLPALWWLQKTTLNRPALEPLLLWPSPSFALTSVLVGIGWGIPPSVGHSLLCLLGLAVLAQIGACWALRANLRTPGRVVSRSRRAAVPVDRARLTLGDVRSPAEWLARRTGQGSVFSWGLFGLLGACWLIAWWNLWAHPNSPQFGMITVYGAFGLHMLFKCQVAFEASRRLSEDLESGALELLLVTPLEPRTLIEAEHRRLVWVFRWPALALSLMNGLMVIQAVLGRAFGPPGSSDRATFVALFLGGIALLWIDFRALIWTGLNAALRRRQHQRAALVTIGRVLGLPWLAILLFVFLAATGLFRSTSSAQPVLLFWGIGGAMLSQWNMVRSHTQLIGALRRRISEGA